MRAMKKLCTVLALVLVLAMVPSMGMARPIDDPACPCRIEIKEVSPPCNEEYECVHLYETEIECIDGIMAVLDGKVTAWELSSHDTLFLLRIVPGIGFSDQYLDAMGFPVLDIKRGELKFPTDTQVKMENGKLIAILFENSRIAKTYFFNLVEEKSMKVGNLRPIRIPPHKK